MLIDTHAHAHFNAYKDDMDEVIRRSLDKSTIINLVGTQADTSKKAVEIANKYNDVYASVGLHPEHLFSKQVDEEETSFVSREENYDYEYYKKLAMNPKVIGIGECGLDFYRIPKGLTKEAMLPKQRETFLLQIKLAKELNLPIVIHCREAHEEMLEALRSIAIPTTQEESLSQSSNGQRSLGGVDPARDDKPKRLTGAIHCYTSNWQNAEQYLAMGFYIGFTGVITFPPLKKNPQAQADLLEVVQKMPLDKILLETDCPYLSPIPYRGKRGEPWMVEEVAKKIAELKQLPFNEIVEAANANAKRLFTKIIIN